MASGAMPVAWKQAVPQPLVPALHVSGCLTALSLRLDPSVCPCVARILRLAVSSSGSYPYRALLLSPLPDLRTLTIESPALPLQVTTGYYLLFIGLSACKSCV